MKIRNVLFSLSLFALVAGGVSAVFSYPKSTNEIHATESEPDVIIDSRNDMVNFIDSCNSGVTYEDQLIRLDVDIDDPIVINTATPEASTFKGTFNGNNHLISFEIDDDEYRQYMWTYNYGVIKNFTVVINAVKSKGQISLVRNNYGLIDNVVSEINSTLEISFITGIARENFDGGIISNCTFTGTLSVSSKTEGIFYAGIAYQVSGGSIIGCKNRGSITACGKNAGIAIYLRGGEIVDCINYSQINVTGEGAAGIVCFAGNSSSGTIPTIRITRCINYGFINGKYQCGGIVAYITPHLEITYCSNYGKVKASDKSTSYGVGGIFSAVYPSSTTDSVVQYCYNGGDCEGVIYVGGIGGRVIDTKKISTRILNCFSTGNVKATDSSTPNTGTLLAFANADNVVVSDSYAVGDYDVPVAAPEDTYGYGIGSGTARDDSSSLSHGVSDDFRDVVRFIRDYNCEEDISEFKNTFNSLSEDEINLLDQVAYYDEHTELVQRTYKEAAEYIIGYQEGRLESLTSLNYADQNLIIMITFITISSTAIATLFLLIVVKRKRVR